MRARLGVTLSNGLCLTPDLRPGVLEVADRSACGDVFELLEHRGQDGPLQLPMAGDAKDVAHHERHEHGAGRLGVFCDVTSDGHADGGDSATFDFALHERDGLVANGSSRCREGDVDLVFDQSIRHVAAQGPLQHVRIHVVADERVVRWVEAPDHALVA